MNAPPINDPTRIAENAGKAENGFNRTVVAVASGSRSGDGKNRSSGSDAASAQKHRKKDLRDIVRGVNINPYISLNLDVSPELESSLDAVDAKYAMLSEFAQGGTATISIARDKNLRRLVAVKSLKKDVKNLPELLDAFVTEAKVTAQLDHPGIISIYGLSRDDENGIHLIMKLVDGKTLREYLRNVTLNYRIQGVDAFDESMMLRKRLEIFLRVCDTIAYAHHRNVIHRDLKPENIMIGKYMEVFVMDWGLAKVISPDGPPPVSSKISGTPRYFPPEVLRGEPLDLRSDIFTLGLILQEIVTLQYAVAGENEKEIIDHILNADLEPIEHHFHRKIDKRLQAVIQKATAYDIRDRYQTAGALAEDLRRYMAGLPVSAKIETLWDRILRYCFERILKSDRESRKREFPRT